MNLDDPKSLGLLSLGLRLMSTPGKFGPALGTAGLGAVGDMQQAAAEQRRQQAQLLQQQMLQMQIEQMQRQNQRQARLDALPGRFFRQPSAPTIDATGGMETAGENPANSNAGGFDLSGYANAMMAIDPMAGLQLQAMTAKQQPSPIKLGANERLLDPVTHKELVGAAPPKESNDEFIQRMRLAGIDPNSDRGRALILAKLQKEASHAPAVNVSYGAPMPAVNPKTGDVELVRPDNRGGMAFTGVKPAPQDRDVKLPAEMQRMQVAGDAMVSLLTDYENLLKKNNPRDPVTQMNPTVRADMQSLKRNIELQFKELQALGALAGPDIQIMRESLADPFTFAGAYYGTEGLLSQIRRARDLVKIRADAVLKSQGKTSKQPEVDNDPLGLRK